MMKVIVTGTLAYDYVMHYSGRFSDRIMPDKIHQISLSFLVDSLQKNFGGTAGNIAYTLKLLGIEPKLVSVAGNDFEAYQKFFLANQIETSSVRVVPDVATGSYFVVTDEAHNQIGSFYKGATAYAKDTSVLASPKPELAVIAPTDQVAMVKYARECQQGQIPYLFDPAFQIDDFSEADLHQAIEGAKILIGNDYEVALIEKKLQLSHQQLLDLVPILITTLANKGSRIETKGKTYEIAAAKAENEEDPTGAGDAYRAGFVAGFIRGFDLQICGQMGSVAAVYTVEKYGTVTHTFSIDEFMGRYFTNYNQKLMLS